jgi:hypothetical protein
VGTSSPATRLALLGAGTTSTSYTNGDAGGAALVLQDTGGLSNNGGQLLFGANQGLFAGIKGALQNGTGPAGDLLFQTRTTSGNIVERMRVNSTGDVGIGTATPAQKLDVNGNVNATDYRKNGILLRSITSADVSFSGLTTSFQTFLLNLPSGVGFSQVVSVSPLGGANDILYVSEVALGEWAGIQTANQFRVTARLGNAVAANTGSVRIYYWI